MQFPVADWTGKHILQVYGTADVNVPPDMHPIPWLAKYGAATKGGTVVDVMQDGDHGGAGTYTQTERMIAFLAARGTKSLPRLASGTTYYRRAL